MRRDFAKEIYSKRKGLGSKSDVAHNAGGSSGRRGWLSVTRLSPGVGVWLRKKNRFNWGGNKLYTVAQGSEIGEIRCGS